ncbi:MAG: carbohydrate ABC transporter substrate-binding protein [Oscillospiraceae bacterium]|nr:carbohydrate ABC transporter substrate-binding protein [Oscillospiraceae bacterium]
MTRHRRTRSILFALVMALVLCLTACANKGTDSTGKTDAGFSPKLYTQTDCSINVVGHYNNFEALEAEFNRFSQFYPNVKLTYTYLDNYNDIIVTALESDEAPDIFFTYPWMAYKEEYSSIYETAEDLSDPALGIDLSCIRSSLLYKDGTGKVPTVPFYTTTYGMLINESIFEKEKLSVPQTYEELISVCDALKKPVMKALSWHTTGAVSCSSRCTIPISAQRSRVMKKPFRI